YIAVDWRTEMAKAKRNPADVVFAVAWAVVVAVVAFGLLVGFIWDRYAFNKMTPTEHLAIAMTKSQGNLTSVRGALRHLAAIPANSREHSDAAKLRNQLEERESTLDEVAAAQAREVAAHAWATVELAKNLKNRGYDLTVTQSNIPNEIVVTSSDFADTDHRVRFLSFMRGGDMPTLTACWAGFTAIRLKSSQFPFGFNESYSLECSK
ncbi:MAG: hypothetical protein ACRD9L_06455, partial [Bryobacteraceae bacterium]